MDWDSREDLSCRGGPGGQREGLQIFWGSFTLKGGSSGLAREQSPTSPWMVGGTWGVPAELLCLMQGRGEWVCRGRAIWVPGEVWRWLCAMPWRMGVLGDTADTFPSGNSDLLRKLWSAGRPCPQGCWSSQPCPWGRWSSQAGGVASALLASLPRPCSGPFSAIPQLVLGCGEGGAGGLFSWWGRCEHQGPTCVVHRALTTWAPWAGVWPAGSGGSWGLRLRLLSEPSRGGAVGLRKEAGLC